MKTFTIDRTEGDFFVCYDKNEKRTDIPKEKIPKGKIGDAVEFDGENYTVNENLTKKIRDEINSLQNSLWE